MLNCACLFSACLRVLIVYVCMCVVGDVSRVHMAENIVSAIRKIICLYDGYKMFEWCRNNSGE